MSGFEAVKSAVQMATRTFRHQEPNLGPNDLKALMPYLEELGTVINASFEKHQVVAAAPADNTTITVGEEDLEPGLDGHGPPQAPPPDPKSAERCKKCGSVPCDCDPVPPPLT